MDTNDLTALVEKVRKNEATPEEKAFVYTELSEGLNTLNGLLENLLGVIREERASRRQI